MNKYKKTIKTIFNKRYRKSSIKSKNFINNFFIYRNHFKKKIFLESIKTSHKKVSDDQTYNLLKKIYLNKEKKYNETLSQFYKKFEFNLKLKKKYNKKFFKVSNFETSIESYVFLGLSINVQNCYDDLQKANLIIKIIDKISLTDSYLNIIEKKNLIKLLQIEQQLIKKIYFNVK